MGQPRRTEPYLSDAQAITDLHEHVLVRHFQTFEQKLAVATMLFRPHDGNAAQDLPAGLVAVKQERGEPAPGIFRRARNQDEMPGNSSSGDEPLVAIDDPTMPLPFRARADHGGIGAAAGGGFGHGEGGARLARNDGLEPFLLLRRRG